MKKHILFLVLLHSTLCFSQTLNINIEKNKFGIDDTLSILVSRIDNISSYNNLNNYNEIIISLDQEKFSFNNLPDSLEYSHSYLVKNINSTDQYTLYFTQLPIVSINTENTIINEPKVHANLVYSDSLQTITSDIGIELRGGFSQSYPKKTYDLEFWEDEFGNIKKDVKFGELRNDDDWILDALYNEPLRLRAYTASKLWLQMHTPYYLNEEPDAKAGADLIYVEIFINGNYNGIYNLSEQVDRKQLKIKKFNGSIRGELYKGTSWGTANTFVEAPTYNNNLPTWGGYEIKHPDEDDIIDWNNLYLFTDFVINTSESDFYNTIWSKFNEENFIDYFLFVNLIRATDNTGKNIYLAKYKKNEPYFYTPWDLDGCFGTNWEGINKNTTDDILTNGFINRIINENPNNTFTKTANKWFAYRENIFQTDTLKNTIKKQYNFFKNNKIYERESLVYANYSFDNQSLEYTLNWLENRLDFLDIYFGDLLSVNTIANTDKLMLYPNPAINTIYMKTTEFINNKKYIIYNNVGQQVDQNYIKNQQINIEKLKPGFYFILIDEVSYKLFKK